MRLGIGALCVCPASGVCVCCCFLQAGDYLDAQDNYHKWYDSRIEKVVPAYATDAELPLGFSGTGEDKLLVHFMGWESRFDLWFKRSAQKLQPLYTKVRNVRFLARVRAMSLFLSLV